MLTSQDSTSCDNFTFIVEFNVHVYVLELVIVKLLFHLLSLNRAWGSFTCCNCVTFQLLRKSKSTVNLAKLNNTLKIKLKNVFYMFRHTGWLSVLPYKVQLLFWKFIRNNTNIFLRWPYTSALLKSFHTLTPRGDSHVTSPYNIHTLSSKEVMKILKLISTTQEFYKWTL